MTKYILAALVGASFILVGCSANTLSSALDIAYANGGAEMVVRRIDRLVENGTITENQATVLKYAAKKSYDQLQTKLNELEVADVEVK